MEQDNIIDFKDFGQTYKAIVRYDGGAFSGWQVQPGKRTAQGEIEAALSKMASQPTRIHGASRTDAGVHAFGQVFSWQWAPNADLRKLRRSLCKMLGPDILIESIEKAPAGFHARKMKNSKRYAYAFSLRRYPDPFLARYAWQIPWKIDLVLLENLTKRLIGTHDFGGFQGGGSAIKNTVRTLYDVRLAEGPVIGAKEMKDVWRIEFHGNGFLYKMVRNLTGTMIAICRGQEPESRLEELLHAPPPFHGRTAPPQGLFLREVIYERTSD